MDKKNNTGNKINKSCILINTSENVINYFDCRFELDAEMKIKFVFEEEKRI